MNNTSTSFTWRGIDKHGHKVSGQQTAASKQALLMQLTQQRIRVLSMQRHIRWHSHRLKPREITTFARQLATLLHAGIALLQSLEVISRGQPNSATHAVAVQIKSHIEAGHALHQALRQQHVFDALFCNLVQVGEMTGALAPLLERITTHREKSEALHRALRSAMTYPLAVMLVAGGVSGLMLAFVVPAFESVFASFGAELPRITRCLIAMSGAFQTYGWAWLLGLLVGTLACQRWLFQQARWQQGWHRVLLHLPLAGRLVRHACMARWSRTLATLLNAGIPLAEGLVAVAHVAGNLHYAVATQQVHLQLMQGQSLASALTEHSHLFQPMLIQMCDIGEASGTLDHMLDKAADHYETSVSHAVAQLSVLVEPLMMVVLGLVIGGMVLALYLPIFQMGQAI